MIALLLSGIAALVIAFGLKKLSPALGGLICAAVYFAVSACTISRLVNSLSASAGDATVGLLAALFTEGLFAAAVWLVTALVIFGIRKLR